MGHVHNLLIQITKNGDRDIFTPRSRLRGRGVPGTRASLRDTGVPPANRPKRVRDQSMRARRPRTQDVHRQRPRPAAIARSTGRRSCASPARPALRSTCIVSLGTRASRPHGGGAPGNENAGETPAFPGRPRPCQGPFQDAAPKAFARGVPAENPTAHMPRRLGNAGVPPARGRSSAAAPRCLRRAGGPRFRRAESIERPRRRSPLTTAPPSRAMITSPRRRSLATCRCRRRRSP